MMHDMTIIDLTHAIAPGIPCWPGDPEPEITRVATIDRDGYLLNRLTMGEHTGTHIGFAAHFSADGMSADAFPVSSLLLPGVMIDVRRECATDHDYMLSRDRIAIWEDANGKIPERSVVMMNSGWSGRWGDPDAYLGRDDPAVPAMRFPGFGLDAARYLAEERGVIGLGIDTHGIDAGIDAAFSVNAYWLRGERFHLENLTSLDALPATGITLIIGALNIAGGSGAPARVLALVKSVE